MVDSAVHGESLINLRRIEAVRAFPRKPASVQAARAFIRRVLGTVETGSLDEILLCASELATNSVRHSAPEAGRFLLRVDADANRVRVEVHDRELRNPRLRNPKPYEGTGRGLLIVAGLASRWGVAKQPFGKYVWFELDRQLPIVSG